MKHLLRPCRGGALLALFAIALAGCGGDTTSQQSQTAESGAPRSLAGDPVSGDWLVVRLESQPAHLNPYLEDSGAYTVSIVDGNSGNLLQGLVRRDPETLEFVPELAESWEISGDHMTYTFKLRKDVTFSDGVPFTSHDVEYTVNALLDPKNDTADIRSYLVNLDHLEVVDDYTVVYHCKKPYFGHLEYFGGLWMFPAHLYEGKDFNTNPVNRAPVGTGPYKLESWVTGSNITLVKRDDYWGEKKPYVDKIMYKISTDDNAAMIELQRGDFDYMRVRSADDWLKRTATPAFEAKFDRQMMWSPVDGYLGTFSWIAWNMRRPQFEDKRVRQAMTMLLDRQTILETILNGIGRVVTGDAFPDGPVADPNIKPWPYDPKRAYALLDEAGWIDTDNDGIRDKDGVPFRFEWIYGSGITEYDRMSTVYKEALDRAGIDVTLRPLEWATFLESVYKREFDACMMAWVNPADYDPYQIWHSSQAEHGSNYPGFKNAEADKIMEDARGIFNLDERCALYRRLQAILHEEQPYTFLFNRQRMVVVDKRFEGVTAYPLGFVPAEWWVPKDKQRYQ